MKAPTKSKARAADPVVAKEATVDVDADASDRGQWNSRIGFIFAAVGSAVGLGNIWRFPFMTADNGGAAFVLVYLVFLFTIGLPGLLAELAIGRKAQKNAVGSFRDAGRHGKHWKYVGLLGVVASMTVLSFYAVIAGWTARYFLASFTGGYFADPGSYITGVVEGPYALLFQFLIMTGVAGVIAMGVSNGIEKVSSLMIPALLIISGGIAIYAFMQPGSGAGYEFYLSPNISRLTDTANLLPLAVFAAGQACFSMSLGQGAMVTYGSYLDKDTDLSSDGITIGLADTGVALLAGLMVFPLLAAFGLLGQAGGSGVAFVALPTGFASLGLWGKALGALFFVALFFAAFTSAIALLEVPVSYAVDEWNVPRWKAAILFAEIIAGIGIWSALNQNALEFMDLLAVNTMILTGVFFMSVYAGWFVPDMKEQINQGAKKWKLGGYAVFMLRYVIPAVLLVLIAYGMGDLFDAAANLFGGAEAGGLPSTE